MVKMRDGRESSMAVEISDEQSWRQAQSAWTKERRQLRDRISSLEREVTGWKQKAQMLEAANTDMGEKVRAATNNSNAAQKELNASRELLRRATELEERVETLSSMLELAEQRDHDMAEEAIVNVSKMLTEFGVVSLELPTRIVDSIRPMLRKEFEETVTKDLLRRAEMAEDMVKRTDQQLEQARRDFYDLVAKTNAMKDQNAIAAVMSWQETND